MKNRKKTIVLSSILLVLITVASIHYYSVQLSSLQKLGYSEEKSKKMITPFSIYHIVSNNKEELKGNINEVQSELQQLGVSKVDNLEDKNLVSKYENLVNIKNEKSDYINTELTKNKEQATKMKIKYDGKNKTTLVQYQELSKLVKAKINKENKTNINYLKELGYSNKEIKKLKTKDAFKTYDNILNARKKEEKIIKDNKGFASKDIKEAAMRMFKETNKYRVSKGLTPYKYNYAMQSCVFTEANAFANNGNPHNWLCKSAANENAGMGGINSDYVGSAMQFFKTDPPHEAVLSGNYNSVAIAVVQHNGMMYMIMDVFN